MRSNRTDQSHFYKFPMPLTERRKQRHPFRTASQSVARTLNVRTADCLAIRGSERRPDLIFEYGALAW